MNGIIVSGIILAFFILLFFFCVIKGNNSTDIYKSQSFLNTGMFVGMFLGCAICVHISIATENKNIHPIDVYRGKTMLKIEHKDSLNADTTVVWKTDETIEYQKY